MIIFHIFTKVEERLRMLNKYEMYLKDPNWTSRDENYNVGDEKYTIWDLQQISAGEKISKLETIAMQTIQNKTQRRNKNQEKMNRGSMSCEAFSGGLIYM